MTHQSTPATNDNFRYNVPRKTIDRFFFNVTDTMDEIVERWLREIEADPTDSDPYRFMINNLDAPHGCNRYIVLASYYDGKRQEITKWRRLLLCPEFDTTCRDVIKRILAFYKHKTIRRCMRDHHFFYGFEHIETIGYDINGPIYADCAGFLEIDART